MTTTATLTIPAAIAAALGRANIIEAYEAKPGADVTTAASLSWDSQAARSVGTCKGDMLFTEEDGLQGGDYVSPDPERGDLEQGFSLAEIAAAQVVGNVLIINATYFLVLWQIVPIAI